MKKNLKVLSVFFLAILLLFVSFTFLNANSRTVKVLKDVSDVFNVVGNLIVNGKVTAAKFIGDGAVPSGAIMMFTTTCPAGWTRFSELDAKVARGNNTYGSTGGAETHSHLYNLYNPGTGWINSWGSHTNAVLFNHAVSSWPPYLNVIFCKKD